MQVRWTGAEATALRIALGMSQIEFARRAGVATSTVKKWANRGSWLTLTVEFAAIMDTMLGRAKPDQVARFAAATGRVSDASAEIANTMRPARTNYIELAADLTRSDLMLDRREATRALLGVAIGANLLEPLDGWLFFSDQTPTGEGGRGVGTQELEQLEAAARAFRDWDDQFGGGLRRKAVVGQLSEVNDMLRDHHPVDVKRRLLLIMAQLAETAATMSWDSGQQATAQQYYMLAARVANAAGDAGFCVHALSGMARQMLSLSNPADALELIRLAQERASDRVTPRIEAMLFAREAWAYGKLNRPSAFRRACGKAKERFAEAESVADPVWIEYFDAAELTGTIGNRLLDMARQIPTFASEAATEITKALELRRPDRLRSSALDQLGLAEARLIEGQVEEACRVGHLALNTVARTASERVRVKARGVYKRTDRLGDVAVVAELRDRLRPLVMAGNAV